MARHYLHEIQEFIESCLKCWVHLITNLFMLEWLIGGNRIGYVVNAVQRVGVCLKHGIWKQKQKMPISPLTEPGTVV